MLVSCNTIQTRRSPPFTFSGAKSTTSIMSASNRKAALIVVDLYAFSLISAAPGAPADHVCSQNDFCPPTGSLAVQGGRDIAGQINTLLTYPFTLKLATRDFHPANHISFASQHSDAKPFISSHTIANPENAEEQQTTLLWPDHCVQGTEGCELVKELDTEQLDFILDKGIDPRVESYSAFGPPFRSPAVSMSGLTDRLREKKITEVFCCGLAWDFCVKFTAIDAAKEGFRTFVVRDATKGIDEEAKETEDELKKAGVAVVRMGSDELESIRTGA